MRYLQRDKLLQDLLIGFDLTSSTKRPTRDIYTAIEELAKEEIPVDLLTVAEHMKRKKQFSSMGGSAYLAQLSAEVSSAVHIEQYAELLIEYSLRRSLIDLAIRMRSGAQKGEERVRILLDTYEQSLFNLGQNFLQGDYSSLEKVSTEIITRF